MALPVNWTKVRYVLEGIIIVELLSALTYFYPLLGPWIFILVMAASLYLAIVRLDWAIYVLLIDLIIDSKGYLLSYSWGGFRLSLRIGLWLIIMAVWFIKEFIAIRHHQKPLTLEWRKWKSSGVVIFLLMLAWGIINGLIRGNNLSNLFFDANGWLFVLIIGPLFSIKKWSSADWLAVLTAGTGWLVAKTSLLLYSFTHLSSTWQSMIYRWVRDTQVGEITKMSAQFYRIFFQSHIYLLILVVIASWFLATKLPHDRWEKWFTKDGGYLWIIGLGLVLMPIIVGSSRTFWLALGVLMFVMLIAIARRYHWSITWRWLMTMILAGLVSLASIFIIVNFPWPRPQLSFRPADIIEERLGDLESEAGASSRWSLLPAMLKSIVQAPLLGYGFGATITYISADPRVLAQNPQGSYTTYAFEWGWLDIIFKFGLILALWYLIWLIRLIGQAWRHGVVGQAWALGLSTLALVHVFSPYLNHPLGIIWLVGTIVWLSSHKHYESLHSC